MPASQTKASECNVRYGEPAADDRHIHNPRRLPIHECARFHGGRPVAAHPGREKGCTQPGAQHFLDESHRPPGNRGRGGPRHSNAVRPGICGKRGQCHPIEIDRNAEATNTVAQRREKTF